MIIADTSVWIPFFNRPGSLEKRVLDHLIDTDEIVLVGVVLTEILQGCRTEKDRLTLKEALCALHYLEVNQAIWMKAGDTSSGLLRRGITLPIPDLIIAAIALENKCLVYSLDAHFQKIPDLKHYMP